MVQVIDVGSGKAKVQPGYCPDCGSATGPAGNGGRRCTNRACFRVLSACEIAVLAQSPLERAIMSHDISTRPRIRHPNRSLIGHTRGEPARDATVRRRAPWY